MNRADASLKIRKKCILFTKVLEAIIQKLQKDGFGSLISCIYLFSKDLFPLQTLLGLFLKLFTESLVMQH